METKVNIIEAIEHVEKVLKGGLFPGSIATSVANAFGVLAQLKKVAKPEDVQVEPKADTRAE